MIHRREMTGVVRHNKRFKNRTKRHFLHAWSRDAAPLACTQTHVRGGGPLTNRGQYWTMRRAGSVFAQVDACTPTPLPDFRFPAPDLHIHCRDDIPVRESHAQNALMMHYNSEITFLSRGLLLNILGTKKWTQNDIVSLSSTLRRNCPQSSVSRCPSPFP